MADGAELLMLSAGSALINATYAAKHKHSVPGSLVASGVGFLGLSFLGGVWRTDIAVAIAGLIFFAALMLRGLPLIESLSSVGSQPKSTWTKANSGGGSF